MKYLNATFSSRPATEDYRNNWDAVFGRKPIPGENDPAPRVLDMSAEEAKERVWRCFLNTVSTPSARTPDGAPRYYISDVERFENDVEDLYKEPDYGY